MPHAKINVIFINNKMVSLSDNVAKTVYPLVQTKDVFIVLLVLLLDHVYCCLGVESERFMQMNAESIGIYLLSYMFKTAVLAFCSNIFFKHKTYDHSRLGWIRFRVTKW